MNSAEMIGQSWDDAVRESVAMHGTGTDAAEITRLRAALASKRADTERLNWIARQYLPDLTMHLVVDAEYDGQYYVCGDSNKPGYGPTLRAAIDAAMSGLGVESAP